LDLGQKCRFFGIKWHEVSALVEYQEFILQIEAIHFLYQIEQFKMVIRYDVF